MRRLGYLFLLFLSLAGGITSNVQAGPAPYSYSCGIPPQVMAQILKSSAQELGISYAHILAKYEDGSCTVEQMSPKAFKVSTGGGSIVVIELDDVL